VKEKNRFVCGEVGSPFFLGDCLLGGDQDFDWFRFFRDSSGLLRESVDKGAAFFVDSELDSPGGCAHDVY